MSITLLYQQLVAQYSTVYETDEARAMARELIEYYTERSLQDAIQDEVTVPADMMEKITVASGRLMDMEPLQYVLGEAWFYNLPFNVNKHVLIPRPETEELVYKIIAQIANFPSDSTLLDIGTGSGCIPISIKKNKPNVKVYGMDISEDALSVAKQNAERNNVEVEFFKGDILNEKELHTSNGKQLTFDIIVSNPPYITEVEKKEMHRNVLAYEPHLALFVTNNDPLQFYEAIAVFASKHLVPQGELYVEVNAMYGNEVKACLEKHHFTDVTITKDMQGKDRIVSGRVR